MKSMKQFIGAAMAAGAALFGATAQAEDSNFSGNVALATDYSFRGISQTSLAPAIQGGFDYADDMFYAGVWASNISFGGSVEIDGYGGVKFDAGPVGLDVGVIYYAYPNAADDGAELDYVEAKFAASFAPTEALSIGGGLYYSPEFTGETGEGLYAEANAAFTITEALAVSGAIGNQSADEADFDGAGSDNYTTWNVGGTYSIEGFGFDLRYVDTDADAFADDADGRVILTVKRAL